MCMAQQINHGDRKPLPKPTKTEKKKPKYIKSKMDQKWVKTRNLYLEGKQQHNGWYICEKCGRQTEGVELHHIVGRRVAPELKYDFANLIAICGQCHGAAHGQNRS
jgi:5-methylcytosine-specific restriction endonuclease McrA